MSGSTSFTVRNLEFFYSPYEGAKTLIDVIDRTISPWGANDETVDIASA